jgi:hypothetical protein
VFYRNARLDAFVVFFYYDARLDSIVSFVTIMLIG